MTTQEPWDIETILVHGGRSSSTGPASGKPTVQPIYASTTYLHDSVEALDQAFSGKTPEGEPAFVYARQANPNANAFEETMALAEKGVGAVACASGMAAIHVALLAAGLTTGTKIVASQDLYGPTIGIIRKLFLPIGAELVLADLCTPEGIAVIQEEQPDVVYVETVSNPLTKMADLAAISAAAQEVGAITIVDSTFSTPYLVRPIEYGFDLVLHSATKYISGHGDSTGGVVISAKNTLLDQLRSYSILLGAMLSPFESHLLLRGLRTLSLRMERHCSNALHVARFLKDHPAIARVHYPGLEDHPQHELAKQLMGSFGGLLAFELKEQTREAAFHFMNALQLCLPVTSLGDVFSLVSYPAISSHRTLSPAELQHMGITEGCIRMSVGVEHLEDILQDLDQALNH
ncbi:trans-sulfuration enzyme family protein [Tengunoibacter tsumagoiensis]|uniref:homocysteine desulfhydrase n=1 Tax=Tengunoibacter tsumagoiensis TaxID=2014871 RepID=A0A401ZYE4_9CHLR|nr:PLP-dependent aspartate aminotransferase family protein [Tengunoibacter tsumagoiensis]GCE11876.1 methionine gamma-lyase [Tengunoibacter tsumagoiensis]